MGDRHAARREFPVAERLGFQALIVESCTVLQGLVRTQETKHLSGFRFPPDLIDAFRRLNHTEHGAQLWKMQRARVSTLHPNFLADFRSNSTQLLEPFSNPINDLLFC
jgi:hypothetical protein